MGGKVERLGREGLGEPIGGLGGIGKATRDLPVGLAGRNGNRIEGKGLGAIVKAAIERSKGLRGLINLRKGSKGIGGKTDPGKISPRLPRSGSGQGKEINGPIGKATGKAAGPLPGDKAGEVGIGRARGGIGALGRALGEPPHGMPGGILPGGTGREPGVLGEQIKGIRRGSGIGIRPLKASGQEGGNAPKAGSQKDVLNKPQPGKNSNEGQLLPVEPQPRPVNPADKHGIERDAEQGAGRAGRSAEKAAKTGGAEGKLGSGFEPGGSRPGLVAGPLK